MFFERSSATMQLQINSKANPPISSSLNLPLLSHQQLQLLQAKPNFEQQISTTKMSAPHSILTVFDSCNTSVKSASSHVSFETAVTHQSRTAPKQKKSMADRDRENEASIWASRHMSDMAAKQKSTADYDREIEARTMRQYRQRKIERYGERIKAWFTL
jgi:hypothetical protein